MQQKTNIFDLNVDQVAKLNKLFPKGYKLITIQQNTKRISQLKKKPKIQYVPIQQIKLTQNVSAGSIGIGTGIGGGISRRNKTTVSYYQGQQYSKNKPIQDYQPQRYSNSNNTNNNNNNNNKVKKQQKQFIPKTKLSTTHQTSSYQQQSYNNNLQQSTHTSTHTQINKSPLSVKQLIQLFQKNQHFYVIQQYRSDYPNKCTYDAIYTKAQLINYGLQQFISQMNQLFINIYGNYPRSNNIYNDAAQLENHLNILINNQVNKLKENKNKQQILNNSNNNNIYQIQQQIPSLNITSMTLQQPLNTNNNNTNNNNNNNNQVKQQYIPQTLPRQSSQLSQSQQLQLLRKKTIINKPDSKNITILDKRILGQNIKKLPNQCLPDICKIVFDTLETRQQYVIDIDTLPLKKVKQLQIYVGNCMNRIGNFQDGNDLRNQGDSSQSSFVIQDDFD